MTTSDCRKLLSKCSRCGDCAVEHFDQHTICYSCNRSSSSDAYEEIPDWAFQEYVDVKKEHNLTVEDGF